MSSHINLCKVCCLKVRKGKYNFIVNLIPKSINGIISNTWDFNMIQIFHRVVLALWAPAPKFIQDRDYAWMPDLTWIWQDRECIISIVSNLAHTFSKIKTQIIGDLEISKTSASFQHWSTKQNNNKNGWCIKIKLIFTNHEVKCAKNVVMIRRYILFYKCKTKIYLLIWSLLGNIPSLDWLQYNIVEEKKFLISFSASNTIVQRHNNFECKLCWLNARMCKGLVVGCAFLLRI